MSGDPVLIKPTNKSQTSNEPTNEYQISNEPVDKGLMYVKRGEYEFELTNKRGSNFKEPADKSLIPNEDELNDCNKWKLLKPKSQFI